MSLCEKWKQMFYLEKMYLAFKYYILLWIYHAIVNILELNICNKLG